MAESAVQSKILKYLESIGAYTIKTIATNRAGVPDIIACYKGKFVAIECKDEGKLNRLTPLQMQHLSMIRHAGGASLVADSVESVRAFFETKLKGLP